eukprot:13483717-Alexandrium_andersonii.AAC.1
MPRSPTGLSLAHQYHRIARFRGSGPPRCPFSSADSESAQELRRVRSFGFSGTTFEAVPGPTQSKP